MEIVPWFLRIIVEKTLQTRTILYGVVCRRVGNGSKNTFQFQRERVVSAIPFQFICSMISKMGRVSSASQPRRVGFFLKFLARVFIFLVCEKEISIFPFSLSCLFGGCSWVGRRRRGRRAAGGADRRDRGHRSAAAENDARSAGQEEEECGVQDGGWGWAVVFGSFMIHVVGTSASHAPFFIFFGGGATESRNRSPNDQLYLASNLEENKQSVSCP